MNDHDQETLDLISSVAPWNVETDALIERVRAVMAARDELAKRLGNLEKTHAGDHRGFIASRRALVEQRDRIAAERDAAVEARDAAEAKIAALGSPVVEYSIVRDADGHRFSGYNEDCRAGACDCYLAKPPTIFIGAEHSEQREVYRSPWVSAVLDGSGVTPDA